MRILFVGDIVGSPGRQTLDSLLPVLRERHSIDFAVVNGENSAGGIGITEKTAEQIFAAGADAITLGNHVWKHREVYPYLDRESRVVRPANYPKGNPGRGATVVENAAGMTLGVINLSGQVFLDAARSPFAEVDAALAELRSRTSHILVDMHAEATSEKVAMGWHLAGRATACVGTHTHVPTADARVLPGGTAYITDVGMTGPHGGVIGATREAAVRGFVTQMSQRLGTSEEDPALNGVVIEADGEGRALSIEQVIEPL